MTPTTLINGAPAAAPAAAAPAAAAPVVDAAALQAQIDELKDQAAEANRSAEYWAAKARSNGTPAPAAAAPVEDEPDVLEAITTGGVKGFDTLAEKRGFIKRAEVEQLITQRANSLTEEQQLMKDYPDLQNKKSEFFLSTARVYGDLVKNGMPQQLAMGTAARTVELELIKAGKIKLPSAVAADTAAEKEATRLRRIAAQSGGSGSRSSATEEEDTDLDANQLRVVRQMLVGQPGPDGKPMNEEQAIERYKSRAKSGVAMRGGR